MAYLDDHRPARSQFGNRGRTASGIIVLHSAENTPDTIGPDQGAEGVAAFIRGRSEPGSYHWLADSDSLIDLVRMSMAAWGDGTGSNSHAIHISAATQAHRWASLSKDWKEGCLLNMARAAHKASDYVFELHKVRIPAKRVSRAVSDQPGEGFITHAERDPARRSDPRFGDWEWDTFFGFYRDLEAGATVVDKPVVVEKPTPTRGGNVDDALRRIGRAVRDLEDAKGTGPRGEHLAAATTSLTDARRALREVKFLNLQEAS